MVHGMNCVRASVVVDPVLVEQQAALDRDLGSLPAEMYAALDEAVKLALPMRDQTRREKWAIVVGECNDPRAVEVMAAIERECGRELRPERDKAGTIIHEFDDVARITRAHGYSFSDVPAPPVGRMRTFLFVGGKVIVSHMQIEDEADVVRKQQEEHDAGVAEGMRIFQQKERLISKAVTHLLRANRESARAQGRRRLRQPVEGGAVHVPGAHRPSRAERLSAGASARCPGGDGDLRRLHGGLAPPRPRRHAHRRVEPRSQSGPGGHLHVGGHPRDAHGDPRPQPGWVGVAEGQSSRPANLLAG